VLFQQESLFGAFSMKSGKVLWLQPFNAIQRVLPFPANDTIWLQCQNHLVRLAHENGEITEFIGQSGSYVRDIQKINLQKAADIVPIKKNLCQN
jgi:hypothetical protein